MVYDMTAVGNSTSLLGLYTATNDASGGYIALMSLVAFFVILLFGLLQRNPVPESFTGASTVSVIISLIFLYLDITSIIPVIAFMTIWAMSAIALYRSNSV